MPVSKSRLSDAVTAAFVQSLKDAMRSASLSQADLAELLDCTRPNVSKILAPGNQMTIDTAVRLGHVLNHDVVVMLVPRASTASRQPPPGARAPEPPSAPTPSAPPPERPKLAKPPMTPGVTIPPPGTVHYVSAPKPVVDVPEDDNEEDDE